MTGTDKEGSSDEDDEDHSKVLLLMNSKNLDGAPLGSEDYLLGTQESL